MIRQFVKQQICLGCQGCCRFREADSVWPPCLLDSEISISATRKIRLVPIAGQDNFACAFLNLPDNKCKIYPRRPFECQLYPFLLNRNAEKTFLAVDLKCPFARGRFESKEFKEYAQDLSGILNSPSLRETLKNNPQVIQEYPDAMNLIELKV